MLQHTYLPTHTDLRALRLGLPGVRRWLKLDHFTLPRAATRCLYAADFTPRFIIAPLHHIVPTQAKVDRRIVAYYRQRQNKSIESATGHYPVGIRFQGDPAIYLTNGHHRLVAKRCTGQHRFGLWLYDLAYTLEQAINGVGTDRRVAPPIGTAPRGCPSSTYFLTRL